MTLRRSAAFALFAASAFLIAAIAAWFAGRFGADFDPVQMRVYLWENSVYFLYVPVAVLLFAVTGMLRAFGYTVNRFVLGAGYVAAAALLVASLVGFQIVRPERIDWNDAGERNAAANARNVKNATWLPQQVERARQLGLREGRPVLYYLHADWCHACEDFENFVLGSPYLKQDLLPFIKIRLDVTEMHLWQEYLDRQLGASAVPALIVRDRAGLIVPRPIIGENISLRAVRSVLEAAARPVPARVADES